MADIDIRNTGRAGRITLTRPKALNALTYQMCLDIDAALIAWRNDREVALIVIDAEGERAFCAGGDIAEMYQTGTQGDYDYGRKFWFDEYRMNDRLHGYAKPVVSFLQGFTIGGGVGVGCHGSHRVVGETSQIAMPEVGIGLVPDVGGSYILARAPGRLGEYLGITGARMGPGDAIATGFADHFIPQADWPALIEALEQTGDISVLEQAAQEAPDSPLMAQIDQINRHFGGEALSDILNSLRTEDNDFTAAALKALSRNAPLSMACTVEMIHRLRSPSLTLRKALDMEYRFTFRSMEHGDFLEGIRAQIIDKDRNPNWQHPLDKVPAVAVSKMLIPLGKNAVQFDEEDDSMNIGFIGLGNMGGPMAANLAKAGYSVTGFDTADVAIDGVTRADSAAAAVAGADVVITMLPNGAIVKSVYTSDVIGHTPHAATLIDCSTIDLATAREVADAAHAEGYKIVDAPVSGGIAAANAGTLTFMVGGSADDFAAAEPFLQAMGKAVIHAGGIGNGQAAKICNNMLLAIHMIGTCEAFAMAEKLGLDAQTFYDISSVSSGQNWSMTSYCPVPGVGPQSPSDNDYQGGFATALMLKDLKLAMEAAESAGATTALGRHAQEIYEAFAEQNGSVDFSGVIKTL